MNSADQAAKYRASPKLIRNMIERGDSPNPIKGNLASIIRERLSLGEQLSVEHLLALVHNRALFRGLGPQRKLACDQVGELGDVKAGAAPDTITAQLRRASDGEPESIEIVMLWIKAVLPQGPVRYHWINCRLLSSRWPDLRRTDFNCAWKALEYVREHPKFYGWSKKMRVGRLNPRFYHRPQPPFDL